MNDMAMKNAALAFYELSDNARYVDIVIGAHERHIAASLFSKPSLAMLIQKLQAVHDTMKETM